MNAMSANDSGTNRCYGEGVAQSVNQFVESVTEALSETEAPDDVVTVVEEAGTELADDVEQLEERVENHDTKLNHHLEDIVEVENQIDDVKQDLEAGTGDGNPGVKEGETTLHRPETPLESVVALPEHMADSELTANQERARFLAMDVEDYSQKVPAGRSIDSTTIRKVLKAKDGKAPHTETVSRVMEFLDDLGKDGTKVVKRRGTRRVIFTGDFVERLEMLSTRKSSVGDSDHTVVIGRT